MASDFYYRVKQRDTIQLLCECFNTDIDGILRNNSMDLYAGEWVKINVNPYKTHIVKPMENINTISKKYDISMVKLISDNNLSDEKLFIGQRLKIIQ